MRKIFKIILVCTALILVYCINKEIRVKKDNIVVKKEDSVKKFEKKETKYKKDRTTEVLIDDEISKEDITDYYKHGDHWHVFTKDGKEHITYTDPERIKKGESFELVSVVNEKELNEIKVVSIKIHGDHWHIYTSDGKEFLSYDDPSSKYPNIIITEYVGNHDDKKVKAKKENNDNNNFNENFDNKVENNNNINLNELNIVSILGKEDVDKNDIVRILRHGDHYHIFDSKGREGLTYYDPSKYFPNITIGEYVGNHGNNVDDNKINWPIGITKIIDHKDHWHLYIGDEEVSVVSKDPRPIYPDAEVIVDEDNTNDILVNNDEFFTYDEVEAKLIKNVLPYLSNNLKSMTNYGDLSTNIPVFGSNGENSNIFYWLHNDHYHAITIKQLIQKAKSGEFGENSAKDVVAVLKYKILNPDTNLEMEVTVNFEDVQKYLMEYYNINDKRDVMFLYNVVQIYKNGETKEIHLSQFTIIDNNIVPKIELPKFSNSNGSEVLEDSNSSVDNESLNEKEIENSTSNEEVIEPVDSTNNENDSTLSNNENTIQPENLDEESSTDIVDTNKETEILSKIAQILGLEDNDSAFDAIYDIIDDNFRLVDLSIDENNRTVSVNGKTYELIIKE